MLSVKQLSATLKHARLKNLSQEIGVSVYHLRMIKDGDGNIPYLQLKKVSDFFEGVKDE